MTHGAFSSALLETLQALGSRTTYRTVLDTARAKVERTTADQRPELFPLDRNGPGDGLFLDGTVTPAPATFRMTRTADGWSVDAGLVHGFRDAGGGGGIRAGVRGTGRAGRGWRPRDRGRDRVVERRAHRMDARRRRLRGGHRRGPVAGGRGGARPPISNARLRTLRRRSGRRSRRPVRVVGRRRSCGSSRADAGAAGALRLLLTSPAAGTVQVARLDGTAIGPPTPVGRVRQGGAGRQPAGARRAVGAGARHR